MIEDQNDILDSRIKLHDKHRFEIKLDIDPVSHVDEGLARALVSPIQPIEWTEADDLASQPSPPVPAVSLYRHRPGAGTTYW